MSLFPHMEPASPQNIVVRKQLERFSGTIHLVTHHDPETNYCVLKVKSKGRLVAVTGHVVSPYPGETVECLGHMNYNDKYKNYQFKAKELKVVTPSSIDGIRAYLKSKAVKNIGEKLADVLVDAFGDRVFDVIEKEPERLYELPKIGKGRVQNLVASWQEHQAIKDIMVFLHSFKLGSSKAVKIYEKYGDAAIIRITENPYRLANDIHGIGFRTADGLARQLGIAPDSLIRAKAGVRHELSEAAKRGDCALPYEKLVENAIVLLQVTRDLVETGIAEQLADRELIAEDIKGERCIFMTQLYNAEVGITINMRRLASGPPPWVIDDMDGSLQIAQRENAITLSPTQELAIKTALANKLTVITGGPGVGKTTIIRTILTMVKGKCRITLCAPTGKAAKRMTEATGMKGTDMEAKTIHRTLETSGKDFKRNRENPLDTDLVVVDESSMVDVFLMHKLLAAVPDHAAVLFVGDADQIPSVGPGSVFMDIIESDTVATVKLTEIFRQAATSDIIVNAHKVNNGRLIAKSEKGSTSDFYLVHATDPEDIHKKLIEVVTKRIPAKFGFNPVNDIQVLTPMNRGELGTEALNIEMQKIFNPHGSPRLLVNGVTYAPGDKVIQLRNNYDKNIFNGDCGRIAAIDGESKVTSVDFDGTVLDYTIGELDELALAYAMTIHKSQGSEYPVIIIPLTTQHFKLLERNLLYTGITRGKKLVVLIGEEKALQIATFTVNARKRVTGLPQRLRREFSKN